MKNLKAENKLVVALFIMVLVIFSFAQKDTKKLEQLYAQLSAKQGQLASTKQPVQQKESRQSAFFAKTTGSR
jgi:hypothetical protein